MSEQSSVVVMLRALVMLVCLIVIPLAALFGSSLPAVVQAVPAVVQAVRQGRLPTLAELRGSGAAQQNTLSEAPPFAPTSPETGPTSGPAAGGPAAAGDPMPAPNDPLHQPASGPPAPSLRSTGGEKPTVVPAEFDAPLDRPGGPLGVVADANASPSPGGIGGEDRSVKLGEGGPAAPCGGRPGLAGDQPGRGSDPYSTIQDRLRQLGATYYLLESWGEQERQYRFFCRMAIGGNAQCTRSFWSIDTDPFRAMRQVLEQVEAWRSGRP